MNAINSIGDHAPTNPGQQASLYYNPNFSSVGKVASQASLYSKHGPNNLQYKRV